MGKSSLPARNEGKSTPQAFPTSTPEEPPRNVNAQLPSRGGKANKNDYQISFRIFKRDKK